jgi:hypothetical protein
MRRRAEFGPECYFSYYQAHRAKACVGFNVTAKATHNTPGPHYDFRDLVLFDFWPNPRCRRLWFPDEALTDQVARDLAMAHRMDGGFTNISTRRGRELVPAHPRSSSTNAVISTNAISLHWSVDSRSVQPQGYHHENHHNRIGLCSRDAEFPRLCPSGRRRCGLCGQRFLRGLRWARIFGRICRLSALAELRMGAGSPISAVGAGTSRVGALSTGISVTAGFLARLGDAR